MKFSSVLFEIMVDGIFCKVGIDNMLLVRWVIMYAFCSKTYFVLVVTV